MPDYSGYVRDTLRALQGEFEAIRTNPELSQVGRDRKNAALMTRFWEERDRAISFMRAEFDAIRAEYQKIGEDENAAKDQAAKGWDFQRLAYETNLADKAIHNLFYAQNPDMKNAAALIEDLYNQAANSGDKTRWRAWAEAGPALLPQAGASAGEGGMQLNHLAGRMRADAAKLTATPELEAIGARATALVQRAITADQATREAQKFYDDYPHNPNPPIYSEFGLMRQSIRLTTKFNSSDPEHFQVTSLEIAEPATD